MNSDEDSSDNAGSRSPLLCRHDSLEKPRYVNTSSIVAHHKTAKSCPTVGKRRKPPFPNDATVSTPDDLSAWISVRKTTSKRERYLHGGKKLSLPATSLSVEPLEAKSPSEPRRLTRERRSDFTSWSTERVGLEWLFEHTDSETDCTPGKFSFDWGARGLRI